MATVKKQQTFTKAQFLASNQFTPGQKDILQALLAEDKTYTQDQVTEAIKSFLSKHSGEGK